MDHKLYGDERVAESRLLAGMAFLAENPQFTLEPLPLPAVFPENETGMLALVPGQYDTDGFFIARMRRSAQA